MLDKDTKGRALNDEALDEVNGGLMGIDLVQRGKPGKAQTAEYDLNSKLKPVLLGNAPIKSANEVPNSKVVSGGAYAEDHIFDMGKC